MPSNGTVWSRLADQPNYTAVCPDTDGDGTHDVWDDDNDGDGVVDAVDLAPSTNGGTHDDSNPVNLTVNNLQPNLPVFVDLQVRPTDSRQLSYIGSMLDLAEQRHQRPDPAPAR